MQTIGCAIKIRPPASKGLIPIRETVYTKDIPGRKILVEREFDAPPADVWRAWTEPALLDQWWAPRPWKAETISMDFREGGKWVYCMVGPGNERHWSRAEFHKIVPGESYEGIDCFTDEQGNINRALPVMHWLNRFSAAGTGTRVQVELRFDTEADLRTIVEMGFEEGFKSAHGNLDELLAARRG